jgi:hypothetical protein
MQPSFDSVGWSGKKKGRERMGLSHADSATSSNGIKPDDMIVKK